MLKKILDSDPQYYINTNSEFKIHFDKYQNVMSEIKNNHLFNLIKEDLKLLVSGDTERVQKLLKSHYDLSEYNSIVNLKERISFENLNNMRVTISNNGPLIVENLKTQKMELFGNCLTKNNLDIAIITQKLGISLQSLNVSDLIQLKTLIENDEILTLLTLEPILISKIGFSLLIRNWVYIHCPKIFSDIINNCYTQNSIINEKINNTFFKKAVFKTKYLIQKYELNLSNKIVLGSIGLGGLISSLYLNTLKNSSITAINFNNNFDGYLGLFFNNFRVFTGKLVYESAYTFSHLTNQMFLGALVPKTQVFNDLFKNFKK